MCWPSNSIYIKGISMKQGNQFAKAIAQTMDFSPQDGEREQEEAATIPYPVEPDGLFYGLAGDMARIASENSEADPVAVLVTTLVYFAATCGAGVTTGVGDTRHPARINAVNAGQSSKARKGTSFEPVKKVFRASPSASNVRVSPGPMASGEGLVYAVRDASEAKDKETGAPLDPGVEDKRLLVVESEFASVPRTAGKPGNTLSTIIRCFYDSGDCDPLTKNNKTRCTGAHVCILGHITIDELLAELQGPNLFNGFANRFLWLCVRRRKLVPRPRAMPSETVETLAKRLDAAIKWANEVTEVEMDEDAGKYWDSIYPELTQDRPGVYGAVTSRAEANVIRLSLVYALLDTAACIRVSHIKAALALWSYADQSARYIFGNPLDTSHAEVILEALQAGEKSQTDLSKLFNGHLGADKLRKTLSELEGSGRITRRTVGGGRGQGRAKTNWSLTPGFEA
jgi:hypothetical protein